MTKLTQQEIEQERVKFESHLKSKNIPKKIKYGMYEDDRAFNEFNGWLARAELDKEGKKSLLYKHREICT